MNYKTNKHHEKVNFNFICIADISSLQQSKDCNKEQFNLPLCLRTYGELREEVKMKTEFQYLQNAINYHKLDVILHEKFTDDKRKTTKMFFLSHKGASISPVYDYENMNAFIFGLAKAKELITT